jgi:hypothetical protein
MRIKLLFVVAAACLAAQPVFGQGTGIQANSPEASLLIQGQAGSVSVMQGQTVQAAMAGQPWGALILASGAPALPGPDIGAGFLNLATIDSIPINGTTVPEHRLDGTGIWSLNWQVPWLAPSGLILTLQGAVEDGMAPLGFTLTAPTQVTIDATTVVPSHMFFDPTQGAKGVGSFLPPAGTLPGDLPTLTPQGFPGPTGVFDGGLPVHGVLSSPFTCYVCHGNAQDIWPSYMGTMMANSARDPLFKGQFSIAVAGFEWLHQQGEIPFGGEVVADFCIRCHSPNGWQGGRSGFEGDGVSSAYTPALYDHSHSLDQEGVVCDTCHRSTGFSPNATPSAFKIPGQPDSAQLILSQSLAKRGPYAGNYTHTHQGGVTPYGAWIGPGLDTITPPVAHNPPLQEGSAISPAHNTEHGANMGESTLCGSCHNITSPYTGFAIERTYTEWLNSDLGDPTSPEFQSCQDCHMPAQANVQGCTLPGSNPTYGVWSKIRSALRQHEFVGGNAWIPQILKQMYPMVDLPWTTGQSYQGTPHLGPPSRDAMWDTTTQRAIQKLREAAEVDLTATEAVPGTITASVRVTNLTGHKLPTGYSEGRRMWIQLEAVDGAGAVVYRSGMLDANSELIQDPDLKIYEAKQALDYPRLGLSGPSFHFALNNAVYKDNRILPKGGVQVRGWGGTDSYDPVLAPWPNGGLYPDRQHWDTTPYVIVVPSGAPRPITVRATVLYQTSSYAYVDFLANGGDAIVQTVPHPDAVTVRNLWQSGFAAPAIPVGVVGPTSTADPGGAYPGQTAIATLP